MWRGLADGCCVCCVSLLFFFLQTSSECPRFLQLKHLILPFCWISRVETYLVFVSEILKPFPVVPVQLHEQSLLTGQESLPCFEVFFHVYLSSRSNSYIISSCCVSGSCGAGSIVKSILFFETKSSVVSVAPLVHTTDITVQEVSWL